MGPGITSALLILLLGTQIVVNFVVYRRTDPEQEQKLSVALQEKQAEFEPSQAELTVSLLTVCSPSLNCSSGCAVACVTARAAVANGRMCLRRGPPTGRPAHRQRQGTKQARGGMLRKASSLLVLCLVQLLQVDTCTMCLVLIWWTLQRSGVGKPIAGTLSKNWKSAPNPTGFSDLEAACNAALFLFTRVDSSSSLEVTVRIQ